MTAVMTVTTHRRTVRVRRMRDLRVDATSDPGVEPDIVVEGPDIFQAGRDEASVGAWGDKPWVQTTAEPSMFFNAWEWCRHESDPVMRLETGLAHYNQNLVYDPKRRCTFGRRTR